MKSSVMGMCVAATLAVGIAWWSWGPVAGTRAVAQEKGQRLAPAVVAKEADSMEANNQATKRKLAERVEVEFQDEPLIEVIKFVEEKLDVESFVQRQDLEENGVGLEVPVTLRLKRVRGDMLLDLVLRQVSPEVGYVVRDGIVIVASKGSLSEFLTIRVYNCRDLIGGGAAKAAPLDPSEGSPSATPPGPGGGPMGPGGGPGGARVPGGLGFQGVGSGGMPGAHATVGTPLVQLVQSTVAAESWDINGGPGTLSEFAGLLVVNQSEEVHDRIDKLLQMVREAEKKSAR